MKKGCFVARPCSPPTKSIQILSFKFSQNSNCRINLLFNSRTLKLGHFGILNALFPFLAFFKSVMAHNIRPLYEKISSLTLAVKGLFQRLINMKKHALVHAGEKPFSSRSSRPSEIHPAEKNESTLKRGPSHAFAVVRDSDERTT